LNDAETCFIHPSQARPRNAAGEQSWDLALQQANIPPSSSTTVSRVLEPSLSGVNSLNISSNVSVAAGGWNNIRETDPLAHDSEELFEKHLPTQLLDDDNEDDMFRRSASFSCSIFPNRRTIHATVNTILSS
jgi:hypothetical protein